MQNRDLIAAPWSDYELLDSGENRKLERYGTHIVIRPETQAIWRPMHPEAWKRANAEFSWKEGKGAWRKNKDMPEEWKLSWNDVRFTLRLTSFKHTGIFPEQAPNWEWIVGRTKTLKQPALLNLFAYTGIASIVAAQQGARVTHVDASRQSNTWARENALASGTAEGNIRYILDDALKFAEREVRRGASYDGIILDPPAFGRGPKGEVWKIEEQLPRLLGATAKLLSKKTDSFFLLNGYSAGYSPQSFMQAVADHFADISDSKGEFGELGIGEKNSGRAIPAGIYVRFTR